MWEKIYAVSVVLAVYGGRLKRVETNYENSALSYEYPDLALSGASLTEFLKDLGARRSDIRAFMDEAVAEHDRFIVFDGHRILSSSRTMTNAETGYDTKMRYRPQINLIYMFSVGDGIGEPVYYKQFQGSTLDIKAFADMLRECDAYGKDCTVIGDKGFGSEETFDLLDEQGLRYIIPLKRGNGIARGKIPSSYRDYESAFSYHGRSIQCVTFHEDGFDVHLYLDDSLLSDETASLTERAERTNALNGQAAEAEKRRRLAGKGKLTDRDLESLRPVPVMDVISESEEAGTITIRTNRTDLNAFQVYCAYKQRVAVEGFFDTYDNTLEGDSSYMRDNAYEEGWLFLNHISSVMCVEAMEEIAAMEKSKDISYEDLKAALTKIHACLIGDRWQVPPVKRSVRRLCDKLGFDPEDLSPLGMKQA